MKRALLALVAILIVGTIFGVRYVFDDAAPKLPVRVATSDNAMSVLMFNEPTNEYEQIDIGDNQFARVELSTSTYRYGRAEIVVGFASFKPLLKSLPAAQRKLARDALHSKKRELLGVMAKGANSGGVVEAKRWATVNGSPVLDVRVRAKSGERSHLRLFYSDKHLAMYFVGVEEWGNKNTLFNRVKKSIRFGKSARAPK